MHFKIVGPITDIESIASGSSIREVGRLKKLYGGTRWLKRKGVAVIQLDDGSICRAELHWYEAHGVGKKEIKIKRLLGST